MNLVNRTFHGLMREVSAQRLKEFGYLDSMPEAKPIVGEVDLSHDHWIADITVVFPGIEATFRTHFSSRIARILAKESLEEEALDVQTCHSFLTEFCNLVGGTMKNIVSDTLLHQNNEILRGALSIPEKAPSYDEITNFEAEEPDESAWNLLWTDSEPITCVSSVAVSAMQLSTFYNIEVDTLVTKMREAAAEVLGRSWADDLDDEDKAALSEAI